MTTTDLAVRYSRRVALRHERLYGHGYQGPGQEAVFAELTDRLDLRPGLRLLDIGSGLGGDSFRLAERHGLTVVGLDAAPDMTAVCVERAAEQRLSGVSFVSGDVRTTELLTPDSFDVLWTRDCGAFVPPSDKLPAWRRLYGALRPGGQVLVTDYCLGPQGASAEFAAKMAAWGQYMLTPDAYGEMLDAAGFAEVVVEDRSVHLMESMLEGRRLLLDERESFLREMTVEEYDGLLDRWDRKIGFCARGELVWMVLTARGAQS
ncbi:methyltransferase domain-containing protein [Streptomyces sp. NPDC096339]|uniref:methyltransferase domain-containing protein n=1 Tax=Streptomyces sp. NPDC096339 TaxID=3366086 RepID=UPI0037F85E62